MDAIWVGITIQRWSRTKDGKFWTVACISLLTPPDAMGSVVLIILRNDRFIIKFFVDVQLS